MIARNILEKNQICTLRETEEFCLYNGGYYYRGNNALTSIKSIINENCNDFPIGIDKQKNIIFYVTTMAKINLITHLLKVQSLCSMKDFDSDPDVINVKNGMIYLEKNPDMELLKKDKVGRHVIKKGEIETVKIDQGYGRFEKYDHDNPRKSFIQFPIKYDADAKCPEIEKVLIDIFGIEILPLIYEMLGYFLVPHVRYNKAFILFGATGTGKTTFLNIVKQMIGIDFMSSVPLQDLGKRFQLNNLSGKVLNMCDELSSAKLFFENTFKMIVTNSLLTSESKHVQNHYSWKNIAKLLFATNELPKLGNTTTDAFWKRIVLIHCINTFKNGNDKCDILLKDKKYNDKELSGLLNNALEGYSRLEERGHFGDMWNDNEWVKGFWNINTDPVSLFVSEKCVVGNGYSVDYKTFFDELNRFRKTKAAQSISKSMCTKYVTRIEGVYKKAVNKESHPDTSGYRYDGIGFKKTKKGLTVKDLFAEYKNKNNEED